MYQKKQHPLLELRDAAFEAAAPAHARMENDMRLYRNEDYTGETWIKRFKRSVSKSISPQVSTVVNRLIPVFTEQVGKVEVRPMDVAASELEWLAIEELQEHLDSQEALDSESEEVRTLILHTQLLGNGISKMIYDPIEEMVRSVTINPLAFAPAPDAVRSDFKGVDYVVHSTYHNYMTIRKKFPRAVLKSEEQNSLLGGNIRVDEIHIRGRLAKTLDIGGEDDTNIVVAILVDNEPYEAILDPYWYPDFSFSHWRNFLDVGAQGKSSDFWGVGFGTLIEPQQKVLDEFLANYMWITRNLATGRLFAREGVVDQEELSNSSGDIITVRNLSHNEPIGNAIQFAQTPEVPVSLMNMIQLVTEYINQQAPSASPVFIGQSPGASTSGRAISNLQTAVFNQLSDNIRDMNAFRERRARIRLNFIQQFARRSMKPNRWRTGYDLPELDEDTRYQSFRTHVPDTSSLPQTPLGKLQVVSMLAGLGLQIRPNKLMEMIGLAKSYGLSEDDLIQAITPPQGLSMGNVDEAAVAGVEQVPPAER